MNNNLRKNAIIVLDDKKEYVIVDYLTYENNVYAYLCEIGNVENIKMVQFEDDKTLSIVGSDEPVLLEKLVYLFAKNNK